MVFTLKNRFEKQNQVTDKKVFVTGFTWQAGNYITGQPFLKLVSKNTASFEQFKNFAQNLNGQYSIVIFKNSEKWAVCCHTWSYPLFYRYNNNQVYISDNPQNLLTEKNDQETDSFTKLYFLAFGVTPGNSTLINGIYQVHPGELIRFGENKSESFHLFPFSQSSNKTKFEAKKEETLHHLLMTSFEKHFNFLKNKQILLPLTSGYDSRLLGCLLKEFGLRNVICATWGRKKNSELTTAKKVADKLGYKHIFVEYTPEIIENFTADEKFHRFVQYAGHFSSMPFLQDYFAIQNLKSKEIIDTQTVVLPGHPGDFLRGSHLDSKMADNEKHYFISKIISTFGTSFPLRFIQKKQLQNFISQTFFSHHRHSFWKNYEMWDYQERQCKFIGNSSLVFPFFDIPFLMPLFDLDIFKFFQQVPFKQKLGASLYNQTLEKFFFKQHKVGFDLKPPDSNGQIANPLKILLLKIAPQFLKELYYPLEDSIFYREITHDLMASEKLFKYKHPLNPRRYNSYIIQWYLQYIDKNFFQKEN